MQATNVPLLFFYPVLEEDSGMLIIHIRHGESFQNAAHREMYAGNWEGYAQLRSQFTHSKGCSLTPRGFQEARRTGVILKQLIGKRKPVCLASPYLRAQQTAQALRIPNAEWITEPRLRERSKGVIEQATFTRETVGEFREMFERCIHDVDNAAPDGETIRERFNEASTLYRELQERYANRCVVMVTHGETMQIHGLYLSGKGLDTWLDNRFKVKNCHVAAYSQVDPIYGDPNDRFAWMLRSCPIRNEDGVPAWEPITP